MHALGMFILVYRYLLSSKTYQFNVATSNN